MRDLPIVFVFLAGRLACLLAGLLGLVVLTAGPALALDPVAVKAEQSAIDLQRFVQRSRSDGDQIQISTAPGSDGIVRRIAIKAKEEGTRPDWIVFALRNESNEQLVRWLVAPHFRLVDSGVVWPDLGSSRITAVTASQGESPERQESPEADIFEIVLDPGATVTYIAELANPRLPQVYLWNPDDYKDKINGLTLYRGIVIGIAGLLALFLTIVF
ncbi:MAG: sensor domain-containing phosphodiesterase, partial [Alsobacter sp.]